MPSLVDVWQYDCLPATAGSFEVHEVGMARRTAIQRSTPLLIGGVAASRVYTELRNRLEANAPGAPMVKMGPAKKPASELGFPLDEIPCSCSGQYRHLIATLTPSLPGIINYRMLIDLRSVMAPAGKWADRGLVSED
jgi:hypothetical protein